MLLRQQLPVASPIAARALSRAALAAFGGWDGVRHTRSAVREELARRFGASAVALTDSGTSALVLAMRTVVAAGGTVALPAYGCPDLLAAAVRAQVRIRFYDLDPSTLSPDLDSVRRALASGARAVVVAHWYGYPADIHAVSAIARESGAVVIEDAAQHGEGRQAGRELGVTGPLTVLSFGRGKGTTAGSGGALLAVGSADGRAAREAAGDAGGGAWSEAVESWEAEHGPNAKGRQGAESSRGWRVLGAATAQWALGRPALYRIPTCIPGLHLGETVYHPAREPATMTAAACAILSDALGGSREVSAARVRVAEALGRSMNGVPGLDMVRPIAGAQPGYLRLAVRDGVGRKPDHSAGIVRGYPRPLQEERAARAQTPAGGEAGESAMPGARELSRTLFTLPTHHWVSDDDLARIESWGRQGSRQRSP